MEVSPDHFALTVARKVHKVAVGLAVGIGATALTGWFTGLERLYLPLPNSRAMVAQTAIALILVGISLWLWRTPSSKSRGLARVCGLTITFLGLLTCVRYLDPNYGFGTQPGHGELLAYLISPRYQMAFNTAVSFSLLGIALYGLDFQTRLGKSPAEWFALASASLPFATIVGYIYDVSGLIDPLPIDRASGARMGMALLTAFGLLALCVAILTARPERGWMARFLSRSPEGLIARRLLPGGIAALLTLGWLSETGEQIGLYNQSHGAAILVATSTLALVFFIRHSMHVLAGLESRRWQAEVELKRSKELLQMALTAARVGAWEWVIATNEVRCTESAEEIFGISKGAFEGCYESFLKLIHPDDREILQTRIRRALEVTGEPYHSEHRICWPDGTIRWVAGRGNVFRDKDGKPVRMAGTTIDITERKILERELIEASNREQRRLGQDLHDDLGQWLTGIHLESRALLLRLQSKSEADAAHAEKIASSAREALERTRMLARGMTPAVIESGGLASALQELASNSERMFRTSCSCDCSEVVSVRDPEAALQLYRIAQEAICNAVRHGQATEVSVSLNAWDESHARLVIRDNGQGIRLPLPKASGLGLRTMQYRAGLLGAHVDIYPLEGGGTEVVCTFSQKL